MQGWCDETIRGTFDRGSAHGSARCLKKGATNHNEAENLSPQLEIRDAETKQNGT